VSTKIRDSLHQIDVPVRIGVHTGEVELTKDDVRGIAVHIASRIAHIGGTADVLISRTGSGIKFEDFGMHAFKGIPDAWQVFRALG
jgi:class 3 adenylate cyclase